MSEPTTKVNVVALNPFTVSLGGDGSVASPEELLRYLMLGQTLEGGQSAVTNRIERLAPVTQKLKVIPGDQRIKDKLAMPLMHAYGAFLVGNFLGSIALCGTICEMLAIFGFECSSVTINNQPLGSDEQKKLFGSTFEKLGQQRRVEILQIYKIFPENIADGFDEIREIRRRYLHLWSNDHEHLENDATKVFEHTVNGVLHFFPQTFDSGKLVVEKRVMKYLARTGAIELLFQPSAG